MKRCLFSFAVTLLVLSPLAAQEQHAPAADGGTELFRGLFHYYGIKPCPDVVTDYSKLIIVIYGDPKGPMYAKEVRQALAKGGAVLILADTEMDLSRYFPDGNDLSITGQKVRSDFTNLGGDPSHPLISGRQLSLPDIELPPNIAIATNVASVLRIETWPRFLEREHSIRYPQDSYLQVGQGRAANLRPNDYFAAAGQGDGKDPYRCIVAADPDIFSNRMMYASGTNFGGVTPDNFRYANETVKWLKGPTKREYCLFVEAGKKIDKLDDFDYRKMPPPNLPDDFPMPPIPDPMDRPVQAAIAKFVDSSLADLEQRNAFDRAIAGTPNDKRWYGALLLFLAIFAVVVRFLLFARRVWFSSHKAHFTPLPTDPLYLGDKAPVGSYEHRRLEMQRGNDFREPVVQYILRMFTERGLPEDFDGPTMPELVIRSRNRRGMTRMIRELWRESHIHARYPLPYTRWKELEPALATVRSAADADLWRFRDASS